MQGKASIIVDIVGYVPVVVRRHVGIDAVLAIAVGVVEHASVVMDVTVYDLNVTTIDFDSAHVSFFDFKASYDDVAGVTVNKDYVTNEVRALRVQSVKNSTAGIRGLDRDRGRGCTALILQPQVRVACIGVEVVRDDDGIAWATLAEGYLNRVGGCVPRGIRRSRIRTGLRYIQRRRLDCFSGGKQSA